MLAVDLGRLVDEAHALLAVLLDMLLRTGVNQVDLQVGELVAGIAVTVATQVPKVDVVGAQVLERPQVAGYGTQVLVRGREGSALEDQQSGLGVDAAVEGGSSSCLVCLFVGKFFIKLLDTTILLEWSDSTRIFPMRGCTYLD